MPRIVFLTAVPFEAALTFFHEPRNALTELKEGVDERGNSRSGRQDDKDAKDE